MMRKSHQPVIEAFLAKQSMRGSMSRLTTDGQVLYSYDMPIAQWVLFGKRLEVVQPVPTNTTKSHISSLLTGIRLSGLQLEIHYGPKLTGHKLFKMDSSYAAEGKVYMARGRDARRPKGAPCPK